MLVNIHRVFTGTEGIPSTVILYIFPLAMTVCQRAHWGNPRHPFRKRGVEENDCFFSGFFYKHFFTKSYVRTSHCKRGVFGLAKSSQNKFFLSLHLFCGQAQELVHKKITTSRFSGPLLVWKKWMYWGGIFGHGYKNNRYSFMKSSRA